MEHKILRYPGVENMDNQLVMKEAPDGAVIMAGNVSYNFLLKCISSLKKSAEIFEEEVQKAEQAEQS